MIKFLENKNIGAKCPDIFREISILPLRCLPVAAGISPLRRSVPPAYKCLPRRAKSTEKFFGKFKKDIYLFLTFAEIEVRSFRHVETARLKC